MDQLLRKGNRVNLIILDQDDWYEWAVDAPFGTAQWSADHRNEIILGCDVSRSPLNWESLMSAISPGFQNFDSTTVSSMLGLHQACRASITLNTRQNRNRKTGDKEWNNTPQWLVDYGAALCVEKYARENMDQGLSYKALATAISDIPFPTFAGNSQIDSHLIDLSYLEENRQDMVERFPSLFYWFHFSLADSAALAYEQRGEAAFNAFFDALDQGDTAFELDFNKLCSSTLVLATNLKSLCASTTEDATVHSESLSSLESVTSPPTKSPAESLDSPFEDRISPSMGIEISTKSANDENDSKDLQITVDPQPKSTAFSSKVVSKLPGNIRCLLVYANDLRGETIKPSAEEILTGIAVHGVLSVDRTQTQFARAGVPVDITFSGLSPYTGYRLFCATTGGMHTADLYFHTLADGTRRNTDATPETPQQDAPVTEVSSRSRNSKSVFLDRPSQLPDMASPDTTITIVVTTRARNSVRCVLTNTNEPDPTAEEVSLGRRSYPRFVAVARRKIVGANDPHTVTFENLQPRSDYHLYCSAGGELSRKLPVFTTGPVQPEKVDTPIFVNAGPNELEVKISTPPSQLHCVVVSEGERPSIRQIIMGRTSTNAEAISKSERTRRGLMRFLGLSPGTKYDLLCATDTGLASDPLSFSTEQGTPELPVVDPAEIVPLLAGQPTSSSVAVLFAGSEPGPTRCVAVFATSTNTPLANSMILAGQGVQGSSPIQDASPPLPSLLVIGNLQPLTEYDIVCASRRGRVSGKLTVSTSEGSQDEARQEPVKPVESSLKVVPSGYLTETAYELAVTVPARGSSVACVAVNPGQIPTASQVMMGQTESGDMAVSAPAGLAPGTTGKSFFFRFAPLPPATLFDAFCATSSGLISEKVSFATLGFSLVPQPANVPSPTSFDIFFSVPVESTVRCIAVLSGAPVPTAPQIMRGVDGSGEAAMSSTDPIDASAGVPVFATIGNLLPNTSYETYCVTDLGAVGPKLAFVTAAASETDSNPIIIELARPTSSSTVVVRARLEDADTFRCTVVEPKERPTAEQVYQGLTDSGDQAIAVSAEQYVSSGESATVVFDDLKPSTSYLVLCATQRGAIGQPLSVETTESVFFLEPTLLGEAKPTAVTIATTTNQNALVRCVAGDSNTGVPVRIAPSRLVL